MAPLNTRWQMSQISTGSSGGMILALSGTVGVELDELLGFDLGFLSRFCWLSSLLEAVPRMVEVDEAPVVMAHASMLKSAAFASDSANGESKSIATGIRGSIVMVFSVCES